MAIQSEFTRRAMLASSAAFAGATALPLSVSQVFGAEQPRVGSQSPNHLCVSTHEWLARRLHDVINDHSRPSSERNAATAMNTCPHCKIHIHAGNEGLIGKDVAWV